MPDEPYRPAPPSPPTGGELERLAAAGQRRILEASAARDATATVAAEKNVRIALGGHYGAPVRRTAYAMIAAGLALAVADTWWAAGLFFPGLATAAVGALVRVFAEPRAFRPRRWETIKPSVYEYNPFSAGPRMCIGASFATMEIKIVLATLLQRFRVATPDGARVDPRVAITMAPRRGLRMRVRSRGEAPRSPGRVRGRVRALVDLPE